MQSPLQCWNMSCTPNGVLPCLHPPSRLVRLVSGGWLPLFLIWSPFSHLLPEPPHPPSTSEAESAPLHFLNRPCWFYPDLARICSTAQAIPSMFWKLAVLSGGPFKGSFSLPFPQEPYSNTKELSFRSKEVESLCDIN